MEYYVLFWMNEWNGLWANLKGSNWPHFRWKHFWTVNSSLRMQNMVHHDRIPAFKPFWIGPFQFCWLPPFWVDWTIPCLCQPLRPFQPLNNLWWLALFPQFPSNSSSFAHYDWGWTMPSHNLLGSSKNYYYDLKGKRKSRQPQKY